MVMRQHSEPDRSSSALTFSVEESFRAPSDFLICKRQREDLPCWDVPRVKSSARGQVLDTDKFGKL